MSRSQKQHQQDKSLGYILSWRQMRLARAGATTTNNWQQQTTDNNKQL